jgi:hypothetical protein
MYFPISEADVFHWILCLIAVQIVLSGAESLFKYKIYQNTGWLSWVYLRRRKMGFTPGKWADLLFAYPNVLIFIACRIVLTGMIVWTIFHDPAGHPWRLRILVVVITAMGMLQGLRDRLSNTGADQMSEIVLVAVCISMLGPPHTLIPTLSIIFIACQSELSYLTSGFFKLIYPGWRDGTSLKDVLSTETFGNATLKRWLDKRPVLYRIGGYCVVFGELSLGLAFLCPPALCLYLLCAGVLFHFLVAAIMGLNTFFWTFCSTYPAIYFISMHFH